MDGTPGRRDFLKHTGLGLAGLTALDRLQPVWANDSSRVRVAVIGCGGQGRGAHIGSLRNLADTEIVAVCDPDAARAGEAAKAAGGARATSDLRQVLQDDTIDAVTIATPDHWHVPAALLALQAGKHVYIEKPCSHNLREGRLLVEAAAAAGKIVQHGTQMRSDPGFREAIRWVHDGVIGDVYLAKAWNVQRRQNIGHASPSAPPPGFDYDLWLGPAPDVPFQPNRHHYTWHWWYDFGTGDAGNDGVHELDLCRWGLGVETHPRQIAALGGKYHFDDDQQFPDTMTATFEYPGDGHVGHRKQLVFEMRLWSTTFPYNVDSGVEFWGTAGKLFFSRRGKLELTDARNRRVDRQPEHRLLMSVPGNLQRFLDAVRGRTDPSADAVTAHLSASLCHLANISCRLGRSLEFDGVAEQIVDDPDAAALLTRQYRNEHWARPESA